MSNKWLIDRARQDGETRGRKTLFTGPLEPRAIKLPIQQMAFIKKVGSGNQSHGIRILALSYDAAADQVELVDYKRGSYVVKRTSYSLPQSIIEIAAKAGDGRYMRGFRLIVKAAMDGKFVVPN